MITDKNGQQIKAGDIVRIQKICKNGKPRTTKYSTTFYPLKSFCNDRFKNAQANEWNEEHVTIEIVKDIPNNYIIDVFKKNVSDNEETIKYYKDRGYSPAMWVHNEEEIHYLESAIDRMQEAQSI